jgi:dTDP-4-amino-4,6-dideoxygalactose transaminase
VPRFADVSDSDFNLDPRAAASAITPSTKAILAVHLYGAPAALEELARLAERHSLALLEDAAQALGSEYEGRKVAGIGTLGCLSFHPTKVLGAFGDAGMVVTGDAELAEKVNKLRVHGASGKHRHELALGGNHRLDALQAAVLSVKLPRLERWIAERAAHAAAYDEAFDCLEGVGFLSRRARTKTNAALYTLRVNHGRRAALREHLRQRDIESVVHYPQPLHLQPALSQLGYRRGDFPVSEAAADAVLSLPLYPELEIAARSRVIEGVQSFFRS